MISLQKYIKFSRYLRPMHENVKTMLVFLEVFSLFTFLFPLFVVLLYCKKTMRRLKKKIFLGICGGVVAVLGLVRMAFPEVAQPRGGVPDGEAPGTAAKEMPAARAGEMPDTTARVMPVPPRENSSTPTEVLATNWRGIDSRGLPAMRRAARSGIPSAACRRMPGASPTCRTCR